MACKNICFYCLLIFSFNTWSQATIRVTVTSVQTSLFQDCDGLFLGNSDFVWEFTATDNTIGFSNNNPALFGVLGFNYAYSNNNNGPYSLTSPGGNFSPNSGLFFDHNYLCASTVPTVINLSWEAYENDDVGNYDILGLIDGQTNLQNVVLPVPAGAGSLNYSFTANSVDPGCNQIYTINLRVDRVPIVVNYLQDDICNANQLALNTTYTFAWCPATLEPNEPAANDIQNAGSLWSKFVAPPSGSVQVSTDLSGTTIGTYFEVYHAADGANCTDGIHPVTGQLIKDKFEYLSHVDFSDGIDLLGIDPEADITFDACDPIPLISYHKLIPGETYYIQICADQVNDNGAFQLRVNGFGGNGPNLEDIPCLSSTVSYNSTLISSAQNSPATTVLNFGCAFDGGSDAGETGQVHVTANPNDYHAYDYPHISLGNTVMNESVWLNFIAPNNGRMVFETDYQDPFYGESAAIFGYDKRFAPGIPADYLCSNLNFIESDEGGVNSFLGGDPSAIINAACLEPGYDYYGMVDPSDAITPLSSQSIKTWVYDPSVVNPTLNPPGNDILCLTLQNPLFEVPVILTGTNPTFQAVAGTNVLACQEYLAGEPNVHPTQTLCANQTVWHYFTAPPSGTVEISLRAYTGLDTLRFNIFELLNGTNCYGGLAPATYTTNGTRYTPIISPLVSGSATNNGLQTSLCCLESGKIYGIQLDGGSPGDEGLYIIEYIQELESDAGDIAASISSGGYASIYSGDTAFVCFGDTVIPSILTDGIGNSTQNIPDCISPGFIIHEDASVPNPVYNSGFTFIDSIQTSSFFLNNSNGSGTFGNPLFNTVYYLSPAADFPNNWGNFSCPSATLENGVPIVFLSPLIVNSSYNNSTCTMTISYSGGGYGAYSNQAISFSVINPSGQVVYTGTLNQGATYSMIAGISGIYTISINDNSCPSLITIDASACSNPCSPVNVPVTAHICEGDSIFLFGSFQYSNGVFIDSLISLNGCDSIVTTNLIVHANPSYGFQNYTLCEGQSILVNGNTYNQNGQFQDTLSSVFGCDSILTTSIFVLTPVVVNQQAFICQGDSYLFNGVNYSVEGVYFDTITSINFGCDSINVLSLFVNNDYQTYLYDTICLGSSYFFANDSLEDAGVYVWPSVGDNGCDSTLILNLYVEDCDEITVYAPNSFTPNGDNLNDTWFPIIRNATSVFYTIYNRWGEKIFSSPNAPWDGKYNELDCPMGVYTFIIDFKDDNNLPQQINGFISLIR